MRYLSWIITIPLAIVVILFAISNRQSTTLTLWPLPFDVTFPLYIVVLIGVVIGILMGCFVAWNAGRKHRKRARAETRRADQLERQIEEMKAREAELREQIATLERSERTVSAPVVNALTAEARR